jgi:hypothetical protein
VYAGFAWHGSPSSRPAATRSTCSLVVHGHRWDFTADSSDDVLTSMCGPAWCRSAWGPAGPAVLRPSRSAPGGRLNSRRRGRGLGADRPPTGGCSAAPGGRPGVAPLRAGIPAWGAGMRPGREADAADPGRESRSGRPHAAAR